MGQFVLLILSLVLMAVPVAVFVVLWQLAGVRRDLRAALRRIESLEWELASLRTKEHPVAPKAAPEPAPVPIRTAAPPVAPVPAPAAAPVPRLEPIEAPAAPSLEQVIGGRWTTWAGAIAIVFAAGFFLRWSFQNNLIGPAGRVILGLAAGAALVIAGAVTHARRRLPVLGDGLAGAGLGILYLSLYGAHRVYGFIGPGTALGAMFAVSVLGTALSVAYSRQGVAVLAFLGGFAAPALVASEHPDERVLLGYLVVLDLLALGVARFRTWPAVGRLAFAGSAILIGVSLRFHPDPPSAPERLGLLTALFAVFLAVPLARSWAERVRAHPLDLALIVGNAAGYFGVVYLTLERWRPGLEAGWALALAALYLALARAHRLRVVDDRAAVAIHLATAAVALTLTFPLAFDGPWVTLAWAAQGAALVAVAPMVLPPRAVVALSGLAALGLAAARACVLDRLNPRPLPHVWNVEFAVHLLVVAALAGAGFPAVRAWRDSEDEPDSGRDLRTVLWSAAAVVLAVLLWREPDGLAPACLLIGELLALAWLARGTTERAFPALATILGVLVAARVIVTDHRLAFAAAVDLFNGPLAVRALAAGALGIAAWRIAPRARGAATALAALSGVLLLAALSFGWTFHYQQRIALVPSGNVDDVRDLRFTLQVGLSVLWTIYAAASLAFGFLRGLDVVRYAGLGLLGITVAKVFLVDLANLDTVYRVLSFLVLGVVLLAVGWGYQRWAATQRL